MYPILEASSPPVSVGALQIIWLPVKSKIKLTFVGGAGATIIVADTDEDAGLFHTRYGKIQRISCRDFKIVG